GGGPGEHGRRAAGGGREEEPSDGAEDVPGGLGGRDGAGDRGRKPEAGSEAGREAGPVSVDGRLEEALAGCTGVREGTGRRGPEEGQGGPRPQDPPGGGSRIQAQPPDGPRGGDRPCSGHPQPDRQDGGPDLEDEGSVGRGGRAASEAAERQGCPAVRRGFPQ